jgi:hypothetical protein
MEVIATQTKWSCPDGSEMAIGGNSVGIYVGSVATFGGPTVVDKDAFQVDGKTYRYDRVSSVDTTHICVKQGQPDTD